MNAILIVASGICLITGIVGCVMPALPGLPLCFVSLILLELGRDGAVFSNTFFIVMGIVTLVAMLLDYIIPLLGAKLYGASRYGTWGAAVGLVIGVFIFPPFGMILGIFLGAILGELIAGKKYSYAVGTGLMSSVGSICALVIKFSLCALIAFYYCKGLFTG